MFGPGAMDMTAKSRAWRLRQTVLVESPVQYMAAFKKEVLHAAVLEFTRVPAM